jgi:hypothetical protein
VDEQHQRMAGPLHAEIALGAHTPWPCDKAGLRGGAQVHDGAPVRFGGVVNHDDLVLDTARQVLC